MSVLPEYFDPSQFVKNDYDHHFTIKRPYTNFSKSMMINFKEYQVGKFINQTNLKLQCIVFERIWETCQNIYGIKEAKRRHRCFESLNYFDQCIKINKFIANDKKYNGHTFSTSKYYNVSPTHEQIV